MGPEPELQAFARALRELRPKDSILSALPRWTTSCPTPGPQALHTLYVRFTLMLGPGKVSVGFLAVSGESNHLIQLGLPFHTSNSK